MQFINTLKENQKVNSVYLIKEKTLGVTKNGSSFCSLILQDKTGCINAKIWEYDSINDEDKNYSVYDFVLVLGIVKQFNNQNQIIIDKISLAKDSDYVADNYFNISKRNFKEMQKELDDIIQSINNSHYKQLLIDIFVNDKEFRNKFDNHQGAKSIHHSFTHGLLEHTLSVVNLVKKIATNYDDINVDLLTTGALLHDIGKVYEIADFPKNDYTDEGQLIGHIVIGYNIISNKLNNIKGIKEQEANELLHLILSHHGQYEFGSPKLPSLMEAYILAMCDNLDAKLEIMREGINSMKQQINEDEIQYVGFNKFLGINYRATTKR